MYRLPHWGVSSPIPVTRKSPHRTHLIRMSKVTGTNAIHLYKMWVFSVHLSFLVFPSSFSCKINSLYHGCHKLSEKKCGAQRLLLWP